MFRCWCKIKYFLSLNQGNILFIESKKHLFTESKKRFIHLLFENVSACAIISAFVSESSMLSSSVSLQQ